MPYTEATLRETLRLETLAPSSVPHRAVKDTKLQGFNIPKDTIVLAGLHALHKNKHVWGDPENFRPERFLDEDGNLNLKKDFSLPFGAGRRLCAGETFARSTMFLCISGLLQQFDLKPVNEQLPDLNDTVCGLARMPRDFWIKMESR
jgi:cytochrome P450